MSLSLPIVFSLYRALYLPETLKVSQTFAFRPIKALCLEGIFEYKSKRTLAYTHCIEKMTRQICIRGSYTKMHKAFSFYSC
jgi:hypothetical protein